MNRHCVAGFIVALCALPVLRADVTIRYQTEMKTIPAFQALVDTMAKAQGANAGVSVRMKGNKGYTTSGKFNQIFDFVKQEVTLLDPAHKSFAVLPVSQLADSLAAAMPQPTAAQSKAVSDLMASMKTKVDSKMTGQTSVIQGVQAEEREVTLTIDMALPGSAAATTAMKLVMQIWTAKASEAISVPAIRELTGYQAWQKYVMDPTAMMTKLMGKMPAMSGTVAPMIEELTKNQSVILRMHMDLYTTQTVDPNAPFMQMNQEVAELSSAPVDAALFEIPKEYTAVQAADLLRTLLEAH
jgi:hypothetical protein